MKKIRTLKEDRLLRLKPGINKLIDDIKYYLLQATYKIHKLDNEIVRDIDRIEVLQNLVLNAAPGEDMSKQQDEIEELTRSYRLKEEQIGMLNRLIEDL